MAAKVKGKIYVNGDPATQKVFLTSGFQAPFQEKDLLAQIDVNSHFQSYATGGSIFHLFTAEELTPEEQEKLIFNIIETFLFSISLKRRFLQHATPVDTKKWAKRLSVPAVVLMT